MIKLREIRERAIADGMKLLSQDEVLEEVANRRSGRSGKMKQTSLREQWLQTKMGHPAPEPVQEAPKLTEPAPEPIQEAPKPRRGRRKKIVLDDDDD